MTIFILVRSYMFSKYIKSCIIITIILFSISTIVLTMVISPSSMGSMLIKIVIGFVLLLFVALRSFSIYMNMNNNDDNVLKIMKNLDPNAKLIHHTNASWYTLRYIELWNPTKPTFIFIHGTPGSLANVFPLLTKTDILKHYHVIIPDRPWFGGSMRGQDMPDIKKQSTLLSELLFLSGNSEKIILVWWSYAGALLPHIAAQHPQKIQSMIIIAGTMDPENQTIWKISYPLHYTWLRYIIPSMLRVTNAEKLASIQQLYALSGERSKITMPVWLIHGKDDRIVKIENTYYAEKMLRNSPKVITKIIDNMGHEIPIAQPQIILDVLEELQQ